jgi:alkylation response protein AidB-like acyl-CoA dehydrogenase
MNDIIKTVDGIISDVVAPDAESVDREGAFPQRGIDALGKAGVLGALSAKEVGGQGGGLRSAAAVVEKLASACGSTAMVTTMHYSGVAVLEQHASEEVRRAAATGKHLSTLAFSEAGSRSQFWAPVGTARGDGKDIVLNGRKSFSTSASHATAYVWSSRPLAAEGASTLWLVPTGTLGVRVPSRFDGLGLRGNDSAPIIAEDARIPENARLGPDGGGLDIMLGAVLPTFNVLSTAFCVGLMDAATQRTAAHAAAVRFEHSDSTLADLPTIRAYIARMRVKTDATRTLLLDTLTALETARADATLRVLECKAAAGEAATEVTDLAMRVCGGAAYRRDVGVERMFRDARASTVMAPTTDHLYEFIGRAVCGMPVFG